MRNKREKWNKIRELEGTKEERIVIRKRKWRIRSKRKWEKEVRE